MSTKLPASAPGRTQLPAEEDRRLKSEDRRAFLRKVTLMTGSALAAGSMTPSARATPLPIPSSEQELGKPILPASYGMPSKHEEHGERKAKDGESSFRNDGKTAVCRPIPTRRTRL